MNWEAFFVIATVTMVFGALLLILFIPLAKLITKKFPNFEISKRVSVLEMLISLVLIALIILPKILISTSSYFLFLNPIAHGFGFYLYGFSSVLFWMGLIFALQKIGYLSNLIKPNKSFRQVA